MKKRNKQNNGSVLWCACAIVCHGCLLEPYLTLQTNKLGDSVLQNAGDQLEGVVVVLRSRVGADQQHAGDDPVALWGGSTILK